MNQLVSLVNEWDQFEKTNPGGDISNFCRYYLAKQQAGKNVKLSVGSTPPTDESTLAKIMGRILGAFSVYHHAAMDKAGTPFRETFYFLNSLYHIKEAKKTELIQHMFLEYTTGMDALSKLIKTGYIKERPHDTDKRAKLVSLSKKGEKMLQTLYPYMARSTEMLFKDMHPEAIKLCISLLADVEVRQSKIVYNLKTNDFDEMYKEVMGTGAKK